jgi:glycosyltransferase involved in cell wall biosynthesis
MARTSKARTPKPKAPQHPARNGQLMPKVALVYDRVNTPFGGAEKVLLALHDIFPEAPLFTSVYEPERATWAQVFKVTATFLQRLPGASTRHRWLAPLMPLAFETFDLDAYEVIISITSAEAKGIITKPNQLHLSYLLTPPRYLYSHRQEYLTSVPSFVRPLIIPWLNYLTWWDQAAAARPDVLIPIAQVVGRRIEQYYRRQPAEVIYPPVQAIDLNQHITPAELKKLVPSDEPFYLVVSRLVPYKRIDLAIQACQKLGRQLVIVGEGPERVRLQQLTDRHLLNKTYFLGSQPQEVINTLYGRAIALLMPGIEDFGITALEAHSAGVPVIVHQASGAAELIEEDETGIHIHNEAAADLVEAMHFIESGRAAGRFTATKLKQNAAKYATTVFCEQFRHAVLTHWQAHLKEYQKGKV